jgi:hypothetical protein
MPARNHTIVWSALALTLALSACSSSARHLTGAADKTPTRSATATTQAVGRSTPTTPGTPGGMRATLTQTCAVLSANTKYLTGLAGGHGTVAQRQIAMVRSLEASAPLGIRADVKTVADFEQHVFESVTAGHAPSIEETPELTSALERVVGWTATHCA